MTASDNSRLTTIKKLPFPSELAVLIVRKAERMACAFEQKALQQMKRDAEKALAVGIHHTQIAREMEL